MRLNLKYPSLLSLQINFSHLDVVYERASTLYLKHELDCNIGATELKSKCSNYYVLLLLVNLNSLRRSMFARNGGYMSHVGD